MNPNEQEIERQLRRAPKPTPPARLKAGLLAQVPKTGANALPESAPYWSPTGGWLRRWWPVLAPAAVSLICAVVLAFQQMEIRNVRESIRVASAALVPAEPAAVAVPGASDNSPGALGAQEREEIERLKQRATQLAAEITALERVQKENEALRAKLNAPPTLSQEELDALAQAKAQAMSINCINNLKQFGLSVRVWALDNDDDFPPNSLSMSNELNTPKILVCPADTNRVVAKNWETFTTANCTYEYLAPSAVKGDGEPTRVLSRCPIHGHVGLCDGSVQAEIAKKHPDWLKERDGKLYLEPFNIHPLIKRQ